MLSAGSVMGQWNTNANGIDYMGGNVGIGTNLPAFPLDVYGLGNFYNVRAVTSDYSLTGNIVPNKFVVQFAPSVPSAIVGSALQVKAETGNGITADNTNELQGMRFSFIHKNDGALNKFIGVKAQGGMPTGAWGGDSFMGSIGDLKGFEMTLYSEKLGFVNYATEIDLMKQGDMWESFTFIKIDEPAQLPGFWSIYSNTEYPSYFNGVVSINTTYVPSGYHLAVQGKIIAEEVKVELFGSWPDFVFEPDYNLPSISEMESFIEENGHLQDVPSAQEISENGISLGEMNSVLLKKIEELSLYIIQQDKRIQELENKMK